MAEAPQSRTLRVGLLSEVHHLDPLKAQDVDSLFVLRQVLESPFQPLPGSAEIGPRLVDGLEMAPGSQTCRARVRKDIVFSDGSPLTADDLAASLARVAVIRDEAAVHAEGDEVVFTLKRPNARFDLALSHPQCGVLRTGAGGPLGTGPYRLAPDSRPGRIHLVRNERYRGETKLDEVIFQTYPLDAENRPTALLEALENGEVHFANNLARDDIASLRGVRKSIQPGISTAILYLNTESAALRDARVRRAIALSIDRLEVTRTSYSNALAFTASSLLPRSLGTADDDLRHDPTAARALLSEPGVELPKRVHMLMMWAPRPYLPQPQAFQQAITAQLTALGIEVVPVPTASSTEFIERTIAGDTEMTLAGWVADTMDAADFLDSNLSSQRVPDADNVSVSTNTGRLRSDTMDAALAAYRARRDAASLAAVMAQVTDSAPLVPIAYGPTTAALSFDVQGFKPSPLGIFPLNELDLAPR